MMEITEVKVFPVRDKKLRAFASIVLDASFMVNDIKIIQGKDGLFISMPSRRQKNGRFKDIAHPLNQETRQVLQDRILAEFRQVADSGEAAVDGPAVAAPESEAEPQSPAASEGPHEPRGPAASREHGELRRPAKTAAQADTRRLPAVAAAAPAAAPSQAPGSVAAETAAAGEAAKVDETVGDAAGANEEARPAEDKSPATEGKSLEEVAEAHLSDSYWTT